MNTVYVLSAVALALQVSAISTKKWSVLNLKDEDLVANLVDQLPPDVNSEMTLGLWQACGNIWGTVDDLSGNVCACLDLPVDRWSEFPARSLNTSRVFSILGALLVLTGMVLSGSCQKWAGACLLLGGLCSLLATLVWYNNLTELQLSLDDVNKVTLKMELGYSYFLNLLGSLLALWAGVSCLSSKNKKQ